MEGVTPAKPERSSRGEAAARLVFWIGAYLFLIFVFLKIGQILWVDPEMPVRRVDFLVFWAAAKLTLAGQPLAAFDSSALLSAPGYPAEYMPKHLLWLYPPGFLAMIAPLGAMPFWAAWCVFMAVSATVMALALRAPAAPVPGGWRLMVVSPVMLMGALPIGQTSALWTAGLVTALWAMQKGRPALAGLCIALLTLKPQLGLLIPFALAADRRWEVMIWAIGFTAILTAAVTPLFGVEYWLLFVNALADVAGRLQASPTLLERTVSVYGFLRATGLEHGLALSLQWMATVLLVLVVGWAWSRRSLSSDLKAAVFCAAIPIASPYAFYYEMVLTLAAGMFLFRDGFGRNLAGALWLFVVWVGPIPGIYLPAIIEVPAILMPAMLGLPIAGVTLGICLIRARRQTQLPASASTGLVGRARQRHAEIP